MDNWVEVKWPEGWPEDGLKERMAFGASLVEANVGDFLEQLGKVASEWKEDRTRVTWMDRELSRRMGDALLGAFPGDTFFSEEEEGFRGSGYGDWCWVLDPIDGTNNYALGLRACGISLGLLYRGYPLGGIFYDGLRHQTLLGSPMGISLGEGVADTYKEERFIFLQTPLPEDFYPIVERLLKKFKIRSHGSAAMHLAHVALGLGMASLDARLKVWDCAAGAALLLATGRTLAFQGVQPFPFDAGADAFPGLRLAAGDREFLIRECGIPLA